ncbi:two-component sensor histidine kinase [Olsenella umbonata]|uniref:histidine kinase n=2 Tax=Parafannyhessea umbonata TaxID=604330 RepID=A0A7X9TAW7_9ACTN|nr:two-component sensor histidine kinase [Parafannyhessea umbonata]
MERMTDKILVLGASLALAASMRGDLATTVVVTLTAVCASAAFEVAEDGHRKAALALVIAPLVLCVLAPAACAVVPLSSYDAARFKNRWLALVPPAFVACLGATCGQSLVTVCQLVVATLFSLALSVRTTRVLEGQSQLHRLQDDLNDRLIALGEKNAELVDAREYETHAAALSERTRIAREIHDSVGHLLTRLVLQVEALKVVHGDEAEVVEDLDEVLGGLNDALSSMRKSVHALEDSGVDLGCELNRLSSECGIQNVTVACSLDAVPPVPVSKCFLLVAREALTNAARHAHASDALVAVTCLPGLWQLRITNDGIMPPQGVDLELRGMGLRSMRARVLEMGGVFSARVDGRWGSERFVVFASVPRGMDEGTRQ